MTLNLTVTRYAGKAPIWPPAATFAHRGGIIGRRSNCDWVLADPDGHISKQHCRIDLVDSRYRITDTSTNGVFLNDRNVPIGFGASAELHDGDVLFIGDYDIAVSLSVDEPVPQPRSRLPDPVLLIEAMLRGGDLPAEILDQTDAETLMHAAGARLRQLVTGMRELIAQRDVAAGDDPFRRGDDDEQALLALLVRAQGEGSSPGRAIRRCFAALQAQETAQEAAARTAAVETLAPFLPETLKARIETRTLLAAATKAKYWDLFETEFGRLRASEPPTGLAKALVALGEAYDEQDRQAEEPPRTQERRRMAAPE
jgi:predicted component of type VI protein secretion system